MVERGCGVGRNIEPVLRLATASSAVSAMVALMKVRAVRVWDRAQLRAWDPHWVWAQLAVLPADTCSDSAAVSVLGSVARYKVVAVAVVSA